MEYEITDDTRDELIVALETFLDTRDKRFMFLKCRFSEFAPNIMLEGSAHITAWNIFSHFEKNQMLGSLTACMNNTFNCDLALVFKV